MCQIAYRCGQHTHILRRDPCKAFEPKGISSTDNAFLLKEGPVDLKELAAGHFPVIRNRCQSTDILTYRIDKTPLLFRGPRCANETLRKFRNGVFLPQMRRQEKHKMQTPVNFCACLYSRLLLGKLIIVYLQFINRHDFNLRRRYRIFGFRQACQLKFLRCRQAALISFTRLYRFNDKGSGVVEHIRSEIIGISICHIDIFTLKFNCCSEPA